MGEQVLRTCYSFVIYNHDFPRRCTMRRRMRAQGNQDIAVHVGTLHFTCKDVMRAFEGDMHDGDVFAINDPYAGGTHFSDVRLIRRSSRAARSSPMPSPTATGRTWAARCRAPRRHGRDMFREGLRITPVRLYDRGVFRRDVANMIASNTRDPVPSSATSRRRLKAPPSARARSCASSKKYGRETVKTGLPRCRTMSAGRAPAHRGASRRHLGDGRYIDRDRPAARA